MQSSSSLITECADRQTTKQLLCRLPPEFELRQSPHEGPELIVLGGQSRPFELGVNLGRQKTQQQIQVVDPQRICDDVEACM